VDQPNSAGMQTYRLADIDRSIAGTALAGASVSVYICLEECEDVWRRAIDHCACFVFQTFEWHATWRQTIARTEDVSEHVVHVADADGRTLLILPLGIYRHRYVRSLQFLGGSVTDYNAPLIDRDFAREVDTSDFLRLWQAVLALLPKVDVVWLARMPQTIDGVANPLAALAGASHTDDAHAATLPANFDEFAAARSTQFFSQNRRYRRRLAKVNPVEACFPEDGEQRIEIVRIMAAQKSQWLRGSGLRDTFDRPEYRAFYERLTDGAFPAVQILVASLRVGNEIVATMWGPIFRTRYYFLVTSYREDWTRYSVGRLLMENVVQWCIAQKLSVFDLTAGDEGYKRSWSDHSLPLYDYLAARSLRGRMIVAYRRGRNRLRANRHIRALARRVLSGLRGRHSGAPRSAEPAIHDTGP
jgi:CelD/BcsL family acetyltransferase involved in cellulose biosynthesis